MSVDTIKVSELTSSPRRGLLFAVQEADQTVAEPLLSTDQALHVYDTMIANAVDVVNGVVVVEDGSYDYERCAAASPSVLGGAGAIGDRLHAIHVETGVTTVAIKDGATTIYTWTVQTGETYKEFDFPSVLGAFTVTPTGGAALAVGRFTA